MASSPRTASTNTNASDRCALRQTARMLSSERQRAASYRIHGTHRRQKQLTTSRIPHGTGMLPASGWRRPLAPPARSRPASALASLVPGRPCATRIAFIHPRQTAPAGSWQAVGRQAGDSAGGAAAAARMLHKLINGRTRRHSCGASEGRTNKPPLLRDRLRRRAHAEWLRLLQRI